MSVLVSHHISLITGWSSTACIPFTGLLPDIGIKLLILVAGQAGQEYNLNVVGRCVNSYIEQEISVQLDVKMCTLLLQMNNLYRV